jgi:serine protease Do
LHDGKPASWRLTTRERELREAREVESKSWGVTVRNFTTFSWLEARRKDRSGVLVDSVRPGGPCAESKPPLRRGDIILAAQGKALTNVAAMLAFTKDFTAKETQPKPALITFERDSQTLLTVADIGPETQDEKPARPAKAWLGVQTQVLTSDLAEALQLEGKKGIRVTQVIPDSPAEKAGVKVGDVFLKLDGQVISASTPSDQELFENLIRAYKVGGDAILTGVRDGQPLTITATLGRQPKTAAELPEYKDDRFEFTAREISLAERVDDKLPASETGLRISAVQNAGWAALAGLSAGDFLLALDGRQVATVAELEKMLKQYRETKPRRVVFFVRRGIHTSYLELEPKW